MLADLTRRAHVGALAASAVWLLVVALLAAAGHLDGSEGYVAQALGRLFPAAAPTRLLAVVVDSPSPFSADGSVAERMALVEALRAAQPSAIGLESSFLYRPPSCSDDEYARFLKAIGRLDHVVLAMNADLAAAGGPAPSWAQVADRLAEMPGQARHQQTPWVVEVLPSGPTSRFPPYAVALVAESLGATGPLEEQPRGTVQLGRLRLPVDERGEALLRPVRWPRWQWATSGQLQWPETVQECRGAVVLVASGSPSLMVADAAAAGSGEVDGPGARLVGAAPATAEQVARILSGKGIRVLPVALCLLLAAVVGLAVAAWLTRASAATKAVTVVGAGLATLGGISAAYALGNVFVPPTAALLSVLGSAVLGVWWEAVCLQGWLQKEVAVRAALLPDARRPGTGRSGRDEVAAALAAAVRWVDVPAVGLLVPDGRGGGAVLVAVPGEGARWSDDPALLGTCRRVAAEGTHRESFWTRGEAQSRALFSPLIVGGRPGGLLVVALTDGGLPPEVEAYLRREAELVLEMAQTALSVAGARGAGGDARSSDLCATQAALEELRSAAEGREHLLAGALAAAADAVLLFGLDGRLLFRNEQAESLLASGCIPDQMDVVALLAKAWHRSRGEVQQGVAGLLVAGRPLAGEAATNGRSYLVSVAPVARSTPGAAALAVTCVDVSRMTEAARLREELMSVATHELRTPLTSIMGYAELLGEDTPEDDPRHPYIAGLTRQAEHLAAIVDDFLQTSRLEAHREELCLEPVALDVLAEGVVTSLQPMAQAREIALVLEPVAGEAVVVGDALALERVLVNLVGNGIKYSPNGATVTVMVEMDGDCGVIRVRDTGIGIPEKDLGRVFEKFYRVRRPETANIRGTGLGLSLVRLIAEAHGGSVRAASVEGVGSVFEVRLPIGGPEEAAAAPEETADGQHLAAEGSEPEPA